jgi:hypothetical protein
MFNPRFHYRMHFISAIIMFRKRLVADITSQDLHERFNKYGKEEWDY